jgi:hypothetical protein
MNRRASDDQCCGAMPDIRQNGDRVPRLHFGFRAVGHGVADMALEDDENFTAVGMIVSGIAAARVKPASTHGYLLAVAKRATGIPSKSAPVEIKLFRPVRRETSRMVSFMISSADGPRCRRFSR